MHCQFSRRIDPTTYDNEGLSDGIDLRHSNYTHLEDRGAIRAQRDWAEHVGPVSQYKGTLGPQWSFMSVSVPECLPERLEIISYANEFAFMHDDVTDHVDQESGEVENDEMMEAFQEAFESSQIRTMSVESQRLGKRKLQAQLFSEMLAIDRECALAAMKAWAEFLKMGSSRKHDTVFVKLEDYVPYRIMDVGEMFWFGVVTFGMGLKIPDHELEKCRALMRPAWIAVGLANDIYSWPKERDAAANAGSSHVINAVWVLMQEHGIDVEQALERCRDICKQNVAIYVDQVKQTGLDTSLSQDLRDYIEAMQYSISGNIIWSKTCPRYNPDVSFNSKQVEWMSNGVPSLSDASPLKCTGELSCGIAANDSTMSDTLRMRNDSRLGCNHEGSSPSSCEQPSTNEEDDINMFCNPELPTSTPRVVLEPFDYVASLPSKGIRDDYIDAWNDWLKIDETSVQAVKSMVKTLHNASLMLDDVQDGSLRRRGQPAAHAIFGVAQTINSAGYHINQAIQIAERSFGLAGVRIVTDQLATLFAGQACDLHNTHNMACPSVEEYIETIDSKTGALFELVLQLMLLKAPSSVEYAQFRRFSILFGRYFQLRDDYKNVASTSMHNEKAFCEDLDAGTFTLPLIHLLGTGAGGRGLIPNLLSMRHAQGGLNDQQKQTVLHRMKGAGSLAHTRNILEKLRSTINRELQVVTTMFGTSNVQLELMVQAMAVM